MPNGTWVVGEMADATAAKGFEWGMTAIPAVKQGGDAYSYTWMEQIWIPKGAANVNDAKTFIAYMYSDAAANVFAQRNAIQPIKGIADKLSSENKIFYSVYDNGAKAAIGNFAAFKAVAGLGNPADYFFAPINSLVSGNITKEQYRQDIITATDKMRENIIK